eukprot:Gb_32227 [translate_table: standard]
MTTMALTIPAARAQQHHMDNHFTSCKCKNDNKMYLCVDVGFIYQSTKNVVTGNCTIGTVLNNSLKQMREEKPRGKNSPFNAGADINTPCMQGRLKEALNILPVMDHRGITINSVTFASLLQACAKMKALGEVMQVHTHIIKCGLEQNVVLGTKLVNMYDMCGVLVDARLVFDRILKKSVLLWNAMIKGYGRNNHYEETLILYFQMKLAGIQPDNFTFPCVLKACAGLSTLKRGKEIHGHIIRGEFGSDVFVGNALVAMYNRCLSIEDACNVFDKMSERDVVSWNTMIVGCMQNNRADEVLNLFYRMQLAGFRPDTVTCVGILPACAQLGALQQGKEIHGFMIRNGFESDSFTGSALIDMYGKCGCIELSRQVFDKMCERDVVLWSVMIAAYAQNGHADALKLFSQMQLAGIKPNSGPIVSVLSACSQAAALQQGKEIHNHLIRSGFESDVFVGCSLVHMYAKCGSVKISRLVFDKMSQRNVVSWNAMIAGYNHNGSAHEALTLFCQMQLTGMKPNIVTLPSVLAACSDLVDLKKGREIHNYIIKTGFESDVFVRSALLTMYTKCGSVEVARRVFTQMPQKNVISWNAMIAGCAQNGLASEALKLYCQMQEEGVTPNSVTTASVLPACGHLAALQHGEEIHNHIIRNGFQSDVFAASALIDMYTKCGSIYIARQVFNNLSEKNVVTWNTMIAGYGMHGHGEDALTLFHQMQQAGVKPDHVTYIALLSACSHAGLVDEGWKYFYHMHQHYHMAQRVEHYACMVDLLGRSGRLDEALAFIKKMPVEPGPGVWGALLNACRIHHNTEIGERVAECILELEPENTGNYVLLSNIYAAAGRWDDVAKVRTMMKDRGLIKRPGCSWIEVKNKVHVFLAGDKSHPQSEKIYAMLESLCRKMKEAGYVPDTSFVLHEVE